LHCLILSLTDPNKGRSEQDQQKSTEDYEILIFTLHPIPASDLSTVKLGLDAWHDPQSSGISDANHLTNEVLGKLQRLDQSTKESLMCFVF